MHSRRIWAGVVWMGIAAVGVAQATEGAPEVPTARIEFGESAGRTGFKLVLEGGAPRSRALLELATVAGPCVRQIVELDENGAWERTVRDAQPAQALEARFRLRDTAGVLTGSNSVMIVPGKQMPPAGAQSGAILIRELMKDPTAVSDSDGEWIEIVNITSFAIDVTGWRLTDDGSNAHTIHSVGGLPVVLQPGVPYVLGNEDDASQNGGVGVDYQYSSFSLNNSSDQINLIDVNGVLVDRIAYDDGIFWPDSPGRSISLSPSVSNAWSNDDGASWCESATQLAPGSPDTGTPGFWNDVCP